MREKTDKIFNGIEPTDAVMGKIHAMEKNGWELVTCLLYGDSKIPDLEHELQRKGELFRYNFQIPQKGILSVAKLLFLRSHTQPAVN